MSDDERLRAAVTQVLRAFDLDGASEICLLGGTATPKFAVRVPAGHFVVRARPAEFANERFIRFDHECLWRLAQHNLPVPQPQRRPNGTSWLGTSYGVFEVLSWVEGGPFRQGHRETITGIGRFLARFHLTLSDDIPPGKEGLLREDHPDVLVVYLEQLRELARTPQQAAQVDRVADQLELVRCSLDHDLYPRLPKAVIHGDIHPGNMKFRAAKVAAVYDFDYLSLQARCRDLVDALMFFAAKRHRPVNPDDIRSLTQRFTLNSEWSKWLLSGYENISPLTALEWTALPRLMRSQWLQIRLRGSRKVPRQEKLAFVTNEFFEMIEWLDGEAPQFFRSLKSY